MPAPADAVQRSSLSLVTDRTFGPYFWGNLISNSGTWFQTITAAVVIFQLTGSTTMVGLVSVMQFGVSLVLSPWAGALTDRVDRRALLLSSQALSLASAATLATWIGLVGVEGLPGPWPILAGCFVTGVGFAFSVPAMQALVPAFVEPEDLDSAIALNSATFNLARAVGPALAGVTLATFGPAVAFGVNALSFLALMGALAVIRPRTVERDAGTDGGRVRDGIQAVRRDSVLVLLLLSTAAIGIGTDPIHTLSPALAARLGGGEQLVGWLVSAFGIGAGITALFVGRLRTRLDHRILAVTGLTGMGAGMIGLGGAVALLDSVPAAVAVLLVAGSGYLIAVTVLTTLIQQRVDEHLRGRVMALWSVAFLGSRPLAALIDGGVADLVGAPFAAAVIALVPLTTAQVLRRRLATAATATEAVEVAAPR